MGMTPFIEKIVQSAQRLGQSQKDVDAMCWALQTAAAEEREACAKLAESFGSCIACDIESQHCHVPDIAAAIRARGQA